MSYPMEESEATAEFWSDVSQIRGVRTNGQYWNGQFYVSGDDGTDELVPTGQSGATPSGPARAPVLEFGPTEKGDSGFFLIELPTDDVANQVNQMVKDDEAREPWWQYLLTILLSGPAGAMRDAVFSMAKDAMDASDASRTFWHEHHFARGDRIYVFSTVFNNGEVGNYRVGCSIIGSDFRRFILKGNVSRADIEACDRRVGVLPDPYPIGQVTISNDLDVPMTRTEVQLYSGSWIVEPPEVIAPKTSVTYKGQSVQTTGLNSGVVYRTPYGDWQIVAGIVWTPHGTQWSVCQAQTLAGADPSLVVGSGPMDASGLPAGSRAWGCFAGIEVDDHSKRLVEAAGPGA